MKRSRCRSRSRRRCRSSSWSCNNRNREGAWMRRSVREREARVARALEQQQMHRRRRRQQRCPHFGFQVQGACVPHPAPRPSPHELFNFYALSSAILSLSRFCHCRTDLESRFSNCFPRSSSSATPTLKATGLLLRFGGIYRRRLRFIED